MLLAEIRDYLAKFLFTGDDVFKKVSVLSGGEGSRLALAKLALTNANLLLLDEPTNHLDIPSQEILQEVLDNYQGTILLVSHDRYLIDALATQIWEIDEASGRLPVFKGTYSQYREWQMTAQESARRERAKAEEVEVVRSVHTAPRIVSSRISAEEKRRRNRIKSVEDQIAELEAQLAVISRQLENPPADPAKVQKLGGDYVRLQAELEARMKEWEELHR
jgi:ATP-binding cassette subfamily F protein 3